MNGGGHTRLKSTVNRLDNRFVRVPEGTVFLKASTNSGSSMQMKPLLIAFLIYVSLKEPAISNATP
jgi:hypothetical protein